MSTEAEGIRHRVLDLMGHRTLATAIQHDALVLVFEVEGLMDFLVT